MNVFDNLGHLFRYVVLANYQTYLNAIKTKGDGDYADELAAINCSQSFISFSEHIYSNKSYLYGLDQFQTRRSYQNWLGQICPEYKVIEAFANATKHGTLHRQYHPFKSLNQIESNIVISQASDENGFYFSAQKNIDIYLDNGQILVLESVIKSTYIMWQNEVERVGLFDKAPSVKPSLLEKTKPRRDSPEGTAMFNFKINKKLLSK